MSRAGQCKISPDFNVTQNGAQFKIYELFISRIFHLIFLDCGWPWELKLGKVKSRIRGSTEYVSTFILKQIILSFLLKAGVACTVFPPHPHI